MKNTIYWALFFIICFSIGLFHGLRPQGFNRGVIFSPTPLSVIITDEVLFPPDLRHLVEQKLNVRLKVQVTRNWESLIVKMVETPSADLIITPSYWSTTLQKQNLLSNFFDLQPDILNEVSSDFLKGSASQATFFPLYWMKSVLNLPAKVTFKDFVKNKNLPLLHLLADEDLILAHLRVWENQGVLNDVLQKKILVHPLEQVLANPQTQGALETGLHLLAEPPAEEAFMSALLVWGAAIPKNSANKATTLLVLDYLASAELQEKWIEESPFSSCLTSLADKRIPLNRKAEWIRDLKLNETIIIESKDIDALKKLREDYKINIL